MNSKNILFCLSFVYIFLNAGNSDTQPIRFRFKNNSTTVMGIVFEERVFQIDPNKEMSLFFLKEKLPVTIAFVTGPFLNRWSGNFTLIHKKNDARTQRIYSLTVVPRIEAKEIVEEISAD